MLFGHVLTFYFRILSGAGVSVQRDALQLEVIKTIGLLSRPGKRGKTVERRLRENWGV